jgi:hypothetical protein
VLASQLHSRLEPDRAKRAHIRIGMKAPLSNCLSTACDRRQGLAAVFLASAFFISLSANGAATRHGHTYVPPGANYTIFGLQGIDTSHMFGDGSTTAQVNSGFESSEGLGVTYDPGNGKLTDFGIGLYQSTQMQTKSTGLQIQLATPTDANHLTITVEDFDLQMGATFFNPGKVEMSLLILGAGGTVYANAQPTNIFPDLVWSSSNTGGKKASTDMWDLNLGKLLQSMHLADTNVTGYVLYADAQHGEKVPSDPYFFVNQTIVSP